MYSSKASSWGHSVMGNAFIQIKPSGIIRKHELLFGRFS